VTELLHGEIARVESLVQAAVALMALIMVIVVWVRTKAFVPTIGALLFGALMTWAINNVAFLEQKVGEEFDARDVAPIVLVDETGRSAGPDA
jgi:hypothetical protein